MASFQIHEDQENRNRDYVSGKRCTQKRAALSSSLANIPDRITIKSQKQPLGINNVNVLKKSDVDKLFKKNDENVFKQAACKQPVPIVPVAQFQAFKVYEDSQDELVKKGIEILEKKHVEEVFKNAYKGNEDRLMTKQEALELAGALEVEKPQVIDSFIDSPMSVEKLTDENSELHQLCKSSRDLFFQLDEYRDEIFKYLCEQEKEHRPKANYMRKQPDISHSMRTILVDWLVEVAEEYKLYTETLYLAVNYIDRFLSFMSVVRAKLQLVGTAAMFIAAKYEEIYPPDVGEFVYITDDTYSKKQVIRMEMLILKVLDFDISVPTAYTFITAMSIANKLSDKVTFLAQYLSELALLEAEPTLEIMPSMMAAAAIAVARHTVGEEAWSSDLEENTGYSLESLKRAGEFLVGMHKKAPGLTQQAIQDKYKVGKYLHVSTIAARDEPIKFD
ncbi:PREDICTED: G2/mitotic-specific cyclin-A [Nicrophorus vespilloides]|uniref:G2/mitotic-specific cyclin-A n=1 Tax=Nicrophorus vespilloides TaxID=110193 RepID=A0ABM1MRF9_NICVS|nr:PREDICTED: G2/mitotic-specific cyclin-A [Nicrophorus vespilloides]